MSFPRAIEIILKREGGYLSAAEAAAQGDPGGETKFGISKRAFPELDIDSLTKDQAMAIYHRDYWTPVSGDFLPWPLSLFVFDSAVNQGTDTAIKILQEVLGVTVDGVLGPVTLNLAQKSRSWHAAKFMSARAKRYSKTKNFDRFGDGWFTRLFIVTMEAA